MEIIMSENNIGNILKKLRKEKKKSQEKLSELTGITCSSIKKYESGLRNPKIEQLKKISDALCVDVNVFYTTANSELDNLTASIVRLSEQGHIKYSIENDSIIIKMNDSSELQRFITYNKKMSNR